MTTRHAALARMLGAACAALLLAAPAASAADPDGDELARKVRDRPRATHGARVMVLELHDSRGRVRQRRMRNFWQLTDESKRLVFAVMEPPELKHSDETRLEAGMTFAVDGGLGVAGRYGARIGDSIAVTETGFEYLTDYPRELAVL